MVSCWLSVCQSVCPAVRVSGFSFPDDNLKNIKPGTINRIIISDWLIINHLISLYVTLSYLPLLFRHLNSLPYFI